MNGYFMKTEIWKSGSATYNLCNLAVLYVNALFRAIYSMLAEPMGVSKIPEDFMLIRKVSLYPLLKI